MSLSNSKISLGDLEGKVVVAIDEEYGYREWIWIPGMTPSELEAWWGEKEDINTFWGRIEGGGISSLQYDWPGQFIRCDEDDALYDLYLHCYENGDYRAYVDTNHCGSHQNPATCLERISDGKRVIHKGAVFD